MGRIRAVKPEFFLHEEMYDLEQETGLPVRLAFIGLWCQADREGRFQWRPRTLKAQILPHDDLDFSRVLHALTTRGFLVRYASQGREYGWIPTFSKHQIINNRERASELPIPTDEAISACENNSLTREARDDDASPTREARVPIGNKSLGNKVTTTPTPTRAREDDGRHDPRLTPVPPDFEVGESLRLWARHLKLTDQQIDEARDEFVRYWTARGEERVNWRSVFMERLKDVAKGKAIDEGNSDAAQQKRGRSDRADVINAIYDPIAGNGDA